MKRQGNYRLRIVWLGVIASITAGGVDGAKADSAWTQKTEMPIKRIYHSTSVVAGKIYVIGGLNAIGLWNPQWEALTRVDEYDPATDTWTRKADMPTVRGPTSTSVVNDKIYVFGDQGNEPVPIVEVYDPATDTWAEQTEMPTGRWSFTTSAVDGIIYVIGGYMPSISSRTGLVEAYDPTTDTWARKADMPTVKTFTSSCVVDGKIYVIGGAWTQEVVEVYDPATDTWTTKAPMPTPRYGLDAIAVDGKIYAIGGWDHSIYGSIYATVEAYDPVTDTWLKGIDIPVTTAGCSASVVDGMIYVMGGTVATHEGEYWPLIPAVYANEPAVYANEPIVDFNGDGKVDGFDILTMVDRWGTDDALCDVGPRPWGDGVVDIEDLKVLAEYIGVEIDDPTLIAHWALDETEGIVAQNTAGRCDAAVIGTPVWHADAGKADGALELDGSTFLATDYVLNPSYGPFSVLMWVQGGAAGQVAISQDSGSDWLAIDAVSGGLMSAVGSPPSRLSTGLLISDATVTDGLWHRVALVWDGSSRALYVDGTPVATDEQDTLVSCIDGLNIGCGAYMTPGTFWTGLIDDVRIYNRAVRP